MSSQLVLPLGAYRGRQNVVPSLIVHESLHAATHALSVSKIFWDLKRDEILAYLTQGIASKVLRLADKHGITYIEPVSRVVLPRTRNRV